jgi:hypothetical protein
MNYGIGPNPADPLYGLFDKTGNFFYQVDYRKTLIDDLYTIIKDYKNVAVVPVHLCTNWEYTLIDNSVCNRWGLDVFIAEHRPTALIHNIVTLIERHNTIDVQTQNVIDNLKFLTKILNNFYNRAPNYRIPEELLIMFDNDPWIKQSIEKECYFIEKYKNIFKIIGEEIKLYARTLNINLIDYPDRVKQQIKQIEFACDQSFFRKYEICST